MHRFFLFVILFSLSPLPEKAVASERSELLRCFASIERFSAGPGDEIGGAEQWARDAPNPRNRQTIAVPGVLGKTEGVYFYTDVGAYFAPQPQDRDTRLFGFSYDLTLPDRYPFRCETTSRAASWADAKAKRFRKGTKCWLFNEHASPTRRYRPVRPRALTGRENPDAALRTAVVLRISSVAEDYRREVRSYRERMAEYVRSQRATGSGAALRNLLGWARRRPLAPTPERRIRALGACLPTEDEALRTQIRSVTRLMEMTPVPTEAAVAAQCGDSR